MAKASSIGYDGRVDCKEQSELCVAVEVDFVLGGYFLITIYSLARYTSSSDTLSPFGGSTQLQSMSRVGL